MWFWMILAPHCKFNLFKCTLSQCRSSFRTLPNTECNWVILFLDMSSLVCVFSLRSVQLPVVVWALHVMTSEDVKRLTADSNGAVAMINVHSLAFKTFTFFHCIDILTNDQRLIWGIFCAMLNSFFSVCHTIPPPPPPPHTHTFKPFTNVLTIKIFTKDWHKQICKSLSLLSFCGRVVMVGKHVLFYIGSKMFRLSKKMWFKTDETQIKITSENYFLPLLLIIL